MNRKLISLSVFLSLFCFAGFVFAQSIVDPLNVKSFGELLTRIAQGVGGIIAGLGTVMIVVAGILYMTSAGSPERMNKAKTALVYAIAGIAVGAAAEAIVAVVKSIIGAS